jgi:chromate transporter
LIYLKLFLNFLYIGALAFGGGYAVLPLISQQCVMKNHWLTMSEFSDLLTISQVTPGPISINTATFVGIKTAGPFGGVLSTLGFIIPPFIIVTILYFIYRKYRELTFMQDILSGLKPGVVALIGIAAVDILIQALWGESAVSLSTLDLFSAFIALGVFFVLRKWKPGVISTILACGVIGVIRELIESLIY